MIVLKQRFKPFSLLPGSLCQIPGSRLFVEAYPALIRILNETKDTILEYPIPVKGPVNRFLIMQDLHRGGVSLFSGPYRYNISIKGEILRKRAHPVLVQDSRFISFGIHKRQDWQMIYRRFDMKEILPIWYRLGKLTPKEDSDLGCCEGTVRLLEDCWDYRNSDEYTSDHMLFLLEKLFLVGFGPCLIPRLYDSYFQGILESFKSGTNIPPILLYQGASLIESLIIRRHENHIEFLKKLPGKFVCGLLTGMLYQNLCVLDLEWTKKCVRKICIKGLVDTELFLSFPSEIKRFRMRVCSSSKQEKTVLVGEPIAINSGITYLLDCFEK